MNFVETKRKQITFFSYVAGILLIWLFFNKTGNSAMAYLAITMELFMVLWSVSGGAVADAVSKVLRSRNMKGQYKNASILRRNTLIVQGVMGALGSAVLFVFAQPIANHLLSVPYCVLLLRILSPLVFLRTVSSVLLGFFQGEGTELLSCITCIVRPMLILILGLMLGGSFTQYGEKVSRLLGQEQVLIMYDVSGIALAVTISEVLIVCFLGIFYKCNRPSYKRQHMEGMKAKDSFMRSVQILYHNMGIKMLIKLLELLPFVIGMILFFRKSEGTVIATVAYGSFVVKYLAVCGLFILPLCAMIIPQFSKITSKIRREEHRLARTVFQAGFHGTVIWALFFAVFVGCMSEVIAGVFGKENLTEVITMLRGGSFIILTLVIGFYFSQLLTMLGKQTFVLCLLGVYNIVFIICTSIMLNKGLGIVSLVYSGLIGQIIYVLLLGFLSFRHLRIGIKSLYVVAVPIVGASIAGIINLLLGRIFVKYVGNIATIGICLILSFACYLLIILFLRNIKEQDMEYMPGVKIFTYFGNMWNLL